jgi:predicted metal-dependent HD superfamily phosphohydrolase
MASPADNITLKMETRWLDLWRRIGAQGDPRRYYDELVGLYSSPDRAYHTLAHIEQCLVEYDRIPDGLPEAPLLEMALWYHDAIYDSREQDSEERSAEFVDCVAHDLGLSEAIGVRMAALIRLTQHHDVPEGDLVAAYLVDIDLAILGSEPSRFAEYDHQIREEYIWVPLAFYKLRRRQVLASFLERPAIYRTPLFHGLYEQQARANLTRVLAEP